MLRVAFVALLAASAAQHAAAGRVASVFSKPLNKNIQGELLVLDAGSLSFRGNHPMGPSTSSADACAGLCARMPGCNSYNWCSRQAGCGRGCKAHVKRHPPLVANMSEPGGIDRKDQRVPLLGYGPWPQPYGSDGCQFEPQQQWAMVTNDSWSFGTCSLKRQRDPAKPEYAQGADEGWVSGVVTLPPECAGLPAEACAGCLASANPAECLACAKDKRAASQPFGYLQNIGSQMLQGCAVCSNITDAAARKQCTACVLNKQPCDHCVYQASSYGTGPPNVAACLGCVAKRGAAYRGGCNACAQSGARAAQCFACLGSFPLKFCKEGAPYSANSQCWVPTEKTACDTCGNAAKSPDAYAKCLACYKSRPQSWGECQSCTWLDPIDAPSQGRCFDCVVKANFTDSSAMGCSPCFYQWVDKASRGRCVECVESVKTPMQVKRTCAYCVGNKQTVQKADTCVACLQALPQYSEDTSKCLP